MKFKTKYNEILTTFSILLLAFIVRSYKVESGRFVTWDEAHFGKFSEKYLSRSFYFDVHPPLGKMLTAFSGWLYDQPLGFKFVSSSEYPPDFDYSGMRRFHAFVSSFTPMFSFLIFRELKFSYTRSVLLTLLFIFENGFTSIGRLILLDSYMLTFTACVAYFLTRLFCRSFKSLDLFYLGVSLGMVLSVKWIGCLTTAFVGILIIRQLWHQTVSNRPLKGIAQDFSKPYEWPLLRRGLRMCSWDDKALKFYMFGNPLVWYVSTLCVLLSPFKFIFRLLKHKREGKSLKPVEGFLLFLSLGGWCFHYLPFFLVGRVLYFHHYYPALFFSIFSIGYVTKGLRLPYLKMYVLGCVVTYLLYSGLTYGFVDKHLLSKFRIVPTWDY